MNRHFNDTVIWMRRLSALTVKEFIQLTRDTILFVFIVYTFTMDIYLAASGVSLQLKEASVHFLDHDKSAMSRELISRFKSPDFRVVAEAVREDESNRLLDTGEAMIFLDIPEGFQETLVTGKSTRVQMQVDTTHSVLGFLASSYAEQITGGFGLEASMKHLGLTGLDTFAAPVILDRHRVWFNPNQEDSWFMGISELLTIITLLSIVLPAAAMVREKERGTVEQLLVSPLSPFQIMFPKVVSMTCVILVGAYFSIVLILNGFFHIPVKGSLVLFFAVTALYVFTTAGLGLLIATLARNLAQMGMMTVFIFIPMLFLSGAWTPPEAMPVWMKAFMVVSPLHYFIDIGFAIFLKGAGVVVLWPSILTMGALGSLIFLFGVARFRMQFGR
jgi:ABC-2 type transport system permease protein